MQQPRQEMVYVPKNATPHILQILFKINVETIADGAIMAYQIKMNQME